MRPKLHLQDLTVLFICPSPRWGTIERRCYQDMLFFRDLGGKVLLACPFESFLYHSARSQDIEVLGLEKEDLKGFLRRVRSTMRIAHWLKTLNIHIVHLYNVDAVPVISLALQNHRALPLLLTYGHPPKRKFGRMLNLWALKRVDSILTFSPIIEESAKMNLPVSPRKFRSIGMGVTEVGCIERPKGFDHYNVLAYVPRSWKSELTIMVLLRAIRSIKEDEGPRKVSLYLYTDGEWEKLPFHQQLMSYLSEQGLDEFVHLVEGEMFSRTKDWHLFVGLETGEAISDIEIISLIKGVPVLFPRTPTRQDLLSTYPFFGESYKKGDARELKTKCLKLLNGHESYATQLDLKREYLLERHGAEGYHRELYDLYSKLFDQRQRLTRHVTHTNS